MGSKPTLANFIMGKSNSKKYFKSIYFSSMLMISISILSQLFFPDQFFFWNHTISSQGSVLKNPIGNFIWRAGIVIIALLKFPDVMFISERLESGSKKLSQISKMVGLIASTGFVFVAIFPEEIKRGGTGSKTNKAFDRYFQPQKREQVQVITAIKQLKKESRGEVVTFKKKKEIAATRALHILVAAKNYM